MSGNILEVLSHPAAADPDFYRKGLDNLNALRDTQAKQAIADITQQSVDPQTGQVDPVKFNLLISQDRRAAWAGLPAMQAQGRAQSEQAQGSTNQLGFNDAQQTQIARGLGAMINQPDEMQTPAAYKAQLLQLRANRTLDDSHLAAANAAIDALGPNPDPRAMRLTGTRMMITGLSTADIARTALPQTQLVTGPQGTVPYTVQPAPLGGPPTGGMTQRGGGFTAGQAPQPAQVPDTRPGAPPGSYTPVIPPGGGGTQPQGAPSVIPIQPQPGVLPGRVRPAPGSPLLNPNAPPPAAAPSPAATPAPPGGPPAAPAVPPAPVAANNQPTYTAPPAGQTDVLQKDIEARTAANLAMGDQQKRLISGNTALQALNLASTGPGTATTSRIYSFLQAQSPGNATPQGAMSDTAWRQVLVKNLLRFAQSSSPKASTDQQLSTQIESNPNPEQLAPAIKHILVQDMGILKRDVAQTREMPAASATGDVVNHIGSFADKTAPEAFMWNEYSGPERTAIEAEYKAKGQLQKLHDSLALAVKHGAIPDPRKVTPAAASPPVSTSPTLRGPGSSAPPPLSLNAQPNPLSAYA